MVALSQNGWVAERGTLDNRPIAGVTLAPGVRSGDVATVLRYLAVRFHREVEPLVAGHCWGYAYRQVRAGVSLSNHASGTAIDLNAPAHPLGKRGTFTGTQRVHLRAILSDLGGVVRWGGDYVNRADEMHFEVVGTPSQVAAVAARIKRPTAPAATTPPRSVATTTEAVVRDLPNLSRALRSNGFHVKAAQHLLQAHGHVLDDDGSFGPETERNVIQFQKARGLAGSGRVDLATWQHLLKVA